MIQYFVHFPVAGHDVVQCGNVTQHHISFVLTLSSVADLCCWMWFAIDPRVEMLSETEDKAKGGNDFQEVRKVTSMTLRCSFFLSKLPVNWQKDTLPVILCTHKLRDERLDFVWHWCT